MVGVLGSSRLLTLMVDTTQYLYKDYFKCIFADYDDINNDATLGLYNAIFNNSCFPYMVLQGSPIAALKFKVFVLFCFLILSLISD